MIYNSPIDRELGVGCLDSTATYMIEELATKFQCFTGYSPNMSKLETAPVVLQPRFVN